MGAGRVALRDMAKWLSAEDEARFPIDANFRIRWRRFSGESNYQYTWRCSGNHALPTVRGDLCPFTQWMR